MPSMRFTDASVRNIKPPPKPKQVSYFDTMQRGLALELLVSYGGTKAWRAVRYVKGHPRTWKIGTYPQMKVKEARAQARAYWESPDKIEANAEIGTFKEIAEDWRQRYVVENKLRSHTEIERMLKRYVYPEWANRKFLEIRRRDVSKLLDHVADEHGKAQADAVLATIRSIMIWHQARDDNYLSPIVRGMRRDKPIARARVLNDDEIRALWLACDTLGSAGALVKLLLLTAQRREKVATMRWSDVDDSGIWTIAAEKREKSNAGSVCLPQLAMTIVRNQPALNDNPYVFASTGKKGAAFNSWSQRKQELDETLPIEMPHWTFHDLRRTARSLMSRADVRPDIAERVLGHAIPGIGGVYDRYQYEEHKTDALNRLAALVEKIINPSTDNVVPFSGRHFEEASIAIEK